MMWFLYTCCIMTSSFLGASSLKCNLCAGSPTSDCANRVASAMAVQTCNYVPKVDIPATTTATMSTTTKNNETVEDIPATTTATMSTTTKNNETVEDIEVIIDQEEILDNLKLHTYCVHLEFGDNENMTTNVERGCGYLLGDMDICDTINNKYSNLKSCEFCTTDQCN